MLRLKIPYPDLLSQEVLEDFRREVRMAAQLKHPRILPLKTADFIDGHFVIAFPLGERTLAERLQSRLSLPVALDFAEQMLAQPPSLTNTESFIATSNPTT